VCELRWNSNIVTVLVAQSWLCRCTSRSKQVVGDEPPVYADVWEHHIGYAGGDASSAELGDFPNLR